MARDRDPSPLFEIISRSRKPADRGIPMPDWMRRDRQPDAKAAGQPGPESAAPADPVKQAPPKKKSTGKPEAADPPKQRKAAAESPADPGAAGALSGEPTARSIGAPDDEEDYGSGAARLSVASAKAWLHRPIVVRLPRGTWMALGTATTLLLLVGYMVGERVGEQRAEALATDYGQAAGSLEAARSRPPRPDLIPPTVAGVEPAPASGSRSGRGAAESSRSDESAGRDPRRPGYNYFRLVSGGRGELERMSAFLAKNGIDSVLVSTNNGFKLMALPGFARPRSDPEAVELHARLRELGRAWRTEHRGSSDWSDMFPERYNPGTN